MDRFPQLSLGPLVLLTGSRTWQPAGDINHDGKKTDVIVGLDSVALERSISTWKAKHRRCIWVCLRSFSWRNCRPELVSLVHLC